MIYGIFSDVHSNLEAFLAVQEALGRERIDAYLCSGDIVGYGADFSACVAGVRGLGAVSVAGNHDLASCGSIDIVSFNEEAAEAALWTRSRLSTEEASYLSSLGLTSRKEECVLTHATLDFPEQFNYMFDAASAAGSFRLMQNKEVCFLGHTHVPAIFSDDGREVSRIDISGTVRMRAGSKYIVNVGSVGQPRDGDPSACYCVFDSVERTLSIRRVAYDTQKARKKIIDSGLPSMLGDRLLIGR